MWRSNAAWNAFTSSGRSGFELEGFQQRAAACYHLIYAMSHCLQKKKTPEKDGSCGDRGEDTWMDYDRRGRRQVLCLSAGVSAIQANVMSQYKLDQSYSRRCVFHTNIHQQQSARMYDANGEMQYAKVNRS